MNWETESKGERWKVKATLGHGVGGKREGEKE
jgi:hypothetical protein